jgi:hypothetical protein
LSIHLREPKLNFPVCLDLAGRWFLNSGIQRPDGGVSRYYRAAEGRNMPVSTEITGYAASVYAYLASVTGEPEYRAAAIRTARFLTRVAWDKELATFPFEVPAAGSAGLPPAYFFDCGIIIRGLLAVWRLTRDGEYLAAAARAAETMAADFLRDDTIHPILRLPSKEPLPYEPRWSRSPGCYQLKSAMAWLDLSKATGDQRFASYFERALQMALDSHKTFLPGEPDRDRVMDRLHAYCYFLEALLPVAGRAEAAEALRDGIARTSTLLRDIAPEFARSDVYAQLLRVRLYCDALGVLDLDEKAAVEEASAVEEFQQEHPEPRIHGGFHFGRRRNEVLPFLNPVSTAFCLQALTFWRVHRAGEFNANIGDLI